MSVRCSRGASRSTDSATSRVWDGLSAARLPWAYFMAPAGADGSGFRMSSIKFHRLWAGSSALLFAIAACSNASDPKDDSDAGGEAGSSGSGTGASGGKSNGNDGGSAPGDNAGENAGGTDSSTGGTSSGGTKGGTDSGGTKAGGGDAGAGNGGTGTVEPGGDGGEGGVVEPPGGGGDPPDDDSRGHTGKLILQVTAAQSPAIVGQDLLYTLTVGNTD